MREWLEFGPYRLLAGKGGLLRGPLAVPLTPKAIEVLRVLIRAEGSVVTKQTLLDEVWAGTFVEESSITKNVSELRKALGERDGGAQYIETFPKRGYRLSVPVRRISEESEQQHSSRKRVAVLPFRTLGRVFDDDSIGLRVADALITRLATTRAITVRSTGAVSQYERTVKSGAAVAGHDLDGDLIIDGSLQEFAGIIRITAQILDGKNGEPLWGESFDKNSSDLLAMEDAIAEELAAAVILFVGAEDRNLLSRRYTENSKAYQLYLRGRYHWSQRSGKAIRRAIEWFRRAIDLDQEYALAYSGLAESYAMLPMLTAGRAKLFMPKARVAAVKALDLDDTLVEARTALAFVRWHYDFDWRRAEHEFMMALEFQPDQATTHQWMALLLAEMGRCPQAITEARIARDLAPRSAAIVANGAATYYLVGRYDEAADLAREALCLDAESLRAHWVVGMSLEQQGRLEHAIDCFETACRLSQHAPQMLGSLGHAYGLAGRTEEATFVLKSLRRQRPRCCFLEEALVELGLGRAEEAVALLKRACEEREFHVVILQADARFATLDSIPEFRTILSHIGLGRLSI